MDHIFSIIFHFFIFFLFHLFTFTFYAFSRRFYPKRLTVHSGYTCFITMCVPWELNPQPFALLTQCSTTEPQEHIYLPASSIKPLQLIQNAAERYIFNEPKTMHVTPLFINLHWLPIAARIKFKALMFAFKTINVCLRTPLPKFITSDLCASRSLRSASERRFIVHPKEAQNHFHRLLH